MLLESPVGSCPGSSSWPAGGVGISASMAFWSAALAATHGRRMEAAQRLGIGRNTITRKIQELGLDGVDEAKNGYSA